MSLELRTSDKAMSIVTLSAISECVRYFRVHEGLKSMVLGVSGGIDSAVTAALARATADQLEKEGREIRVIGYSLPIISNKGDEVERAHFVGEAFCDVFDTISFDGTLERLAPRIDPDIWLEENKIRLGNVKARMRMIYLYDKASKYNGMVLSTDNYTEYLLGFWTLHGDVGDFGFIQKLFKTEVYDLADWMVNEGVFGEGDHALEECIEAIPTDGLGVSSSDLDQLMPDWNGSSREGYRKIDTILQEWLAVADDDSMDAAVTRKMMYDHPVIQRHLRTEFKRNNPVNLELRAKL